MGAATTAATQAQGMTTLEQVVVTQNTTRAAAASASESAIATRAIPVVNMAKQGKHIVGHNNYIPGRSVLTADPRFSRSVRGTGTPVGSVARGQPGFKEQ